MAEDHSQQAAFDTDRQYLSKIYARALLGLAEKSGTVDEVVEELDAFVEVLKELPGLRRVLESPRIAFAEKESMIDKALRERASQPFLNFVKVVCRKGRANCFSGIRDEARRMYDEMSGRLQATMTTAIEVDEAVRQKVGQQLSQLLGKQVVLSASVDPHIIGGLVVRIGDTVYDGSVTNQLKQLRGSAIGHANQQIRQALDRFASDA
jgi:F-type H+-transporting ATPase subunit delta